MQEPEESVHSRGQSRTRVLAVFALSLVVCGFFYLLSRSGNRNASF